MRQRGSPAFRFRLVGRCCCRRCAVIAVLPAVATHHPLRMPTLHTSHVLLLDGEPIPHILAAALLPRRLLPLRCRHHCRSAAIAAGHTPCQLPPMHCQKSILTRTGPHRRERNINGDQPDRGGAHQGSRRGPHRRSQGAAQGWHRRARSGRDAARPSWRARPLDTPAARRMVGRRSCGQRQPPERSTNPSTSDRAPIQVRPSSAQRNAAKKLHQTPIAQQKPELEKQRTLGDELLLILLAPLSTWRCWPLPTKSTDSSSQVVGQTPNLRRLSRRRAPSGGRL